MLMQLLNKFKRRHADAGLDPHQQVQSPPLDQPTCERLWEEAKKQAQQPPAVCDLRRAGDIYRCLYEQALAQKKCGGAGDHARAAIHAAE